MPVRVGGGGMDKEALMQWLRSILSATQSNVLAGPPGAAGVSAGALGQTYAGAADLLSGIGGEIGRRATGAAERFQVGAGFGGVEAPKPPVLTAPTEKSILPGPKVSDQPPRKVVDPLTQPVAGPGFAQGVPPTPQPSFNLGGPGQFQGIGAADMGTMPNVPAPGMGARLTQGMKDIFGPGGAVDWQWDVEDTGISLAPGQTRGQRAEAMMGRQAEAELGATQAGTLRNLSQAGVYELEGDPDFQRFKLMQPALAAALLEENRNKRFDIGRQVSERDVYLEGAQDRRQLTGLLGKGQLAEQQQAFAGINKAAPTADATGRLRQSALAYYFKLKTEAGPEDAAMFWAQAFPGEAEPQAPQQESTSWLPWR